jgi:hypothetical protein
VLSRMLQRYREMPPEELLRVPELLSLLYAWLQGGGTGEPEQWVKGQTETDAGLLAFLSRVRGWGAGIDGVYHPLRRSDLARFLDYDAAVRRLEVVSRDLTASEEDRKLASELLMATKRGVDK